MALSSRNKAYIKFAVKISITAAALFFVFRKIDVATFKQAIAESNWWYFGLGVVMFNLSKIVAAFRLRELYKACGLRLDHSYNLKLYYLGMFYNLFLPGSIGGDGYKVYLLNQNTNTKVKDLISATLLDRLSGLALLVILGGGLLLFSSLKLDNIPWQGLTIAGILLVLPLFYLAIRIVFPKFANSFWRITWLSLIVQIGQVACALMLLWSLSVTDHLTDHLALFMLSSVVAVIPFTVGGVGARELVFLYGHQYLTVDSSVSVAFTLMFFSSTAITALIGLLFAYNIDSGNASVESVSTGV